MNGRTGPAHQIAAVILGLIDCGINIGHRRHQVTIGIKPAIPETCREAQAIVLCGYFQSFDRATQMCRLQPDHLVGGSGKKNAEFLSPQPRTDRRLRGLPLQQLGEGFQCPVSDLMAMAVIDAFEVVDIADDQAGRKRR